MSAHEITLSVPDEIYEQIRVAAERARRSVEDLLREAITAAVHGDTGPRSALAQMAYLNDAALFQAARSTMSPEQRDRLEALHAQSHDGELTPAERDEERALLGLYQETLLVRAQAALLLKQRGYDVSNPAVFQPLS